MNHDAATLLTTPSRDLTPVERALKKQQRQSLKKCPRCSKLQGHPVFYPTTTAYFPVSRSRYDGLAPYCHQCTREQREQSQPPATPRRVDLPVIYLKASSDDHDLRMPKGAKRCSNPYCGRVFPATIQYWGPDNTTPDKISDRCLRCQKLDKAQTHQPPTASPTLSAEEAEFQKRLREQAGQPGFDEHGFPY